MRSKKAYLLLLALSISFYNPQTNVHVVIVLHLDSYVANDDLNAFNALIDTLNETLYDLSSLGIEEVGITAWRDVYERPRYFERFSKLISEHGIDSVNVGLFIPPEEAERLLEIGLESYKKAMGFYPLFVAGFSMPRKYYEILSSHNVKLSFANLWEEGELSSFRGMPTGDFEEISGWEGSPHQPYVPSKRRSTVPALEDSVGVWEAHWSFRNPFYAFFFVNSMYYGSIHPNDLLLTPLGTDSLDSAYRRSNLLLDLIDFNSRLNPSVYVSYVVEVSKLQRSDIRKVFIYTVSSMKERGYRFLTPFRLLEELERSKPLEDWPYLWFDDETPKQLGIDAPFGMITSKYGRFISGQDPTWHTKGPFISFTSYLSAPLSGKLESLTEQIGYHNCSIKIENRELYFSKAEADPKGCIRFIWMPDTSIYLTPYGVVVKGDRTYVQYFNVYRAEALKSDVIYVLSDLGERLTLKDDRCYEIEVNNTLILKSEDGYGLSVFISGGKVKLWKGEKFQALKINGTYVITPATNVEEARLLASLAMEAVNAFKPMEERSPYYILLILAPLLALSIFLRRKKRLLVLALALGIAISSLYYLSYVPQQERPTIEHVEKPSYWREYWKEIAVSAWNYFQPGVGVDPHTGLHKAGLYWPYFTDWDLGVYVMAIIDAHALGLIPYEGEWGVKYRIEKVLSFLEERELTDEGLPYVLYEASTGRPVGGRSSNPYDQGFLLFALHKLEEEMPQYSERIKAIVARCNYSDMVEKWRSYYNVYSYLSALGFSYYGYANYTGVKGVIETMENLGSLPTVETYGVELPKYLITGDPIFYAIFKGKNSSQLSRLSKLYYLAQEARYNATGKLTAFSEGNTGLEDPSYVYEWVVYGDGRTWVLTSPGRGEVSITPIVFTKIAFALHALYNTSYTKALVDTVNFPYLDKGFPEGVDEEGRLVDVINDKTNALILAAARYALHNEIP